MDSNTNCEIQYPGHLHISVLQWGASQQHHDPTYCTINTTSRLSPTNCFDIHNPKQQRPVNLAACQVVKTEFIQWQNTRAPTFLDQLRASVSWFDRCTRCCVRTLQQSLSFWSRRLRLQTSAVVLSAISYKYDVIKSTAAVQNAVHQHVGVRESSSQHWGFYVIVCSPSGFSTEPNENRNAPLSGPQKMINSFTSHDRLVA
jgi:hypothetical protein